MAKYHKLTSSQKDEIRRLTQLANRRIKSAEKAYKKEGLDVLPSEVTGDYQIKEKWNTKATPISRSVKFDSAQDYRRQLNYLRSFEVSRPTITNYTKTQRSKTADAIETSLGVDVPESMASKVNKMSSPQLSKFWKSFSDKASKLGVKYSSEKAMEQTLSEFFPEDMEGFNTVTSRFTK